LPVWNPDQYLKFNEERSRPAMDLCARIASPSPAWILDVGCGTGNSTAILRERWPSAHILGLDNSAEMIERARQDHPEGDWVLADASCFTAPGRFDIVFSNAALQWLPDHDQLLPSLFSLLAPGGVLAVQVPVNTGSPLWQAVLAQAGREPWKRRLAGMARSPMALEARAYYEILAPLAPRVELWETTYQHVMADHQALIAWYEGTGMRPYLEALDGPEQRSQFKAELLEALRPLYPPCANGRLLFGFRRLFLLAMARP
jgi:trans-aconitate 2-methyltransferase